MDQRPIVISPPKTRSADNVGPQSAPGRDFVPGPDHVFIPLTPDDGGKVSGVETAEKFLAHQRKIKFLAQLEAEDQASQNSKTTKR